MSIRTFDAFNETDFTMKPTRAQHQPIELHRIDIPLPCTASWDDMTGDHRVRHCKGCNKNVFNLSAMPAAEGAALIADNLDGDLCVRMNRRQDGSVVSSDCDDSARPAARQPWRGLPGIAGAALLALSAAACSTRETPPEVAVTAGATVNPEPPVTVLMGAPPPSAPAPAVIVPTISPANGMRQCEKDAVAQEFVGRPAAGSSISSALVDSKGICTR
ncbi:hypothetical protein [Massilia pseudoviolaceinigra]|uniref:hypothetical protein n=1 Tax=Massilia pseudoviolaceinigra TaxID=3057165 RepID=UPI0027968AD4|nr:hypothetical protein [Massilia sp. CCM 9206]MDQ1920309.1 hypothetical protein [Massilia sp. CCM 9206]